MENLKEIGKRVKGTTGYLNNLDNNIKNVFLRELSKELIKEADSIIKANDIDIKNAKANNMKESLVDRLRLDEKRIKLISDALIKTVNLQNPVGDILEGKVLESGLEIVKKRVPLGVIAIIYESRPNVTVDAFSLCFKTGNAVILRGGSDAINSNKKIVEVIRNVLKRFDIPEDVIYLIQDISREKSIELMKLNEYVDVLIPRGGAGLIKSVVQNSTIPVIETGTGNCHIYVDEFADFNKAINIIINAKTQRTGVCNACESLVVHEKIAKDFIDILVEELQKYKVEIRGDERACKCNSYLKLANEEDWKAEYLDLILSVKIVNNVDEAIKHVNTYSTKHSEAIITENYENSRKFLNQVDSSCVYVNASTRFTDGEQFGFGAEIGISTQKLHARGPMGLKELTTTKYLIYGNGQIRK